MNSRSAKDILKRLSQGDPSAYEHIFLRYHAKICRFLKSIVCDCDSVEDIAQNVFMKVWVRRGELTQVRSLDNFLFTVARNEACDLLRRRTNLSRYKQYAMRENMDYSEGLALAYDLERIESIVTQCVDNMPVQRKLVYQMSREEKLANAEIAQRLNLSKRTVDRHISLALSDIRSALKGIVSILAVFWPG